MKAILAMLAVVLVQTPSQAQAWDVTQPRGDTREIDFSVTEGTIQSLDVSPDGRWVVFDLLAHIYRVPAAGGTAECLTQDSGIALNFDPRYSPDGKSIAFSSDRNGQNSLWVMDADGANPRLVADGGEFWLTQADWAPDGHSLAATKYLIQRLPSADWTISSRIWRFPVDGSTPTQLIGPGLTYVVAPTFSPDGQSLYYEDMDKPRMAHDMFLVSDGHLIRRLDLASGESFAVTESGAPRPYGFAAAPQLSPDGKTLAFVRRVPGQTMTYRGHEYAHVSGLWLKDLDSGRERLLFAPLHPDHFDTSDGYHLRFATGYAFAHDGKSFVLSQGGQIRRLDVATGKLATIPFSARVQRRISQMARPHFSLGAATQQIRFAQAPASSPDGRTVLFEALGAIWRMPWDDTQAGEPRRLTAPLANAFQFSPAWSRDGRSVVFASHEDGVGGHLWVQDAAGGKPRRVTREPQEYFGAEFSADGRRLIALRGNGALARGLGAQDSTLYLLESIALDGKSPAKALAHFTSRPSLPRAGPGGRLYFTEEVADYSDEESGPEFDEYQPRMALVSLDATGHDRREHARFPYAGHVAISADGGQVVFDEAHNLLLAELPGEAAAGFTAAGAPFFDRSDTQAKLRWLTRRGGLDARWMSATRLEYVSGAKYFRFDTATGKTESRDLGVRFNAAQGRGRVAFTGARILTLNAGQVIEKGDLVVDGARIACVGQCDLAGVDTRIDARGKTLMPGLIDAHAHPGYDGGIRRQHQHQLGIYTAYGVTTILDPSADESRVFPAADMADAGLIVAPRILSSGPVVIPTHDMRPLRNAGDAIDDVERLASWGAVTIKQYTLRRRDQRQWLVDAARRNGHVMVTSERLNLYYDLGTIMDGQTGWEHPLTEHPIYSDVVKFVAASGANYTPALQASGQGFYAQEYWQGRTALTRDQKFLGWIPWRERDTYSDHRQRALAQYPIALWNETVKDILEAGGSVSVGAHSKWDGIGAHRELWTFAMAVPPARALETATILTARYLGIDRDLGSLEPGKLADLVVLNSNPLEDIRNTADIACVMQGGVLYDDESLDEIWPAAQPYGARPWLLEARAPTAMQCTPRPIGPRP